MSTQMSRDVRKPVFRVSDQVRHKQASYRIRLDARDFGYRKKMDCTVCVAKTKVLISCAVTAQLICAFVFAYAKICVSHDMAQITVGN